MEDEDPKIVCQAIRSLIIFDDIKKVSEELKKLINHPNEMVRTAIYKKYFSTEENNKSQLPHTKTYEFLKNVVVNGDVLKVLEYVPDDSFHLTFTSPPYYNARDYSIYPSYESYLEFLNQVFQQIHRTTKQGRFLIVNTSPIIIPRISRAHSSKRYAIPFDLHYYSYKGDLVFDPFGGSGTVGKVAKALDRLFFLTEQNVEYFNYIQSQESTPSLFQKRKTKFLTFTEFQNISFKKNDVNRSSYKKYY